MVIINKVWDVISCIGINIFNFVIWVYKMLVTSDISVEISLNDTILISSLLALTLIIYSFYVRKTKCLLTNIIGLLLPLFLWSMSMIQSLIHQYRKYDTFISSMGFLMTMIILINLIYRKISIKTDI